MKKRFSSILAIGLVTGGFVACGDSASGNDDMDPTQKYSKVDSYDDLPLCSKSNDGDSVYLADERMYLYCADGFWSEFVLSADEGGSASSNTRLNIYAEADDTIPSLSMLYNCSYGYDSMVVFVASLNSYMRCLDYEWKEYKPAKTKSSSSKGTSMDTIATISKITSYPCNSSHEGDSIYVKDDKMILVCDDGDWTEYVGWSSSSYRSSSSSARDYRKGNVLRDSVLGVCNASKEGQYAIDADDEINESSTDTYVCRSGLWLSTTEFELDTKGFPTDTVVGALKNGVWAEYYSSTDAACTSAFKTNDRYTYVFTGSTWRKANTLEICFSKACLPTTAGTVATKGTVTYMCNGSAWKEQLFYDMSGKSFFNSGVSYGSLTDTRDGKTYKTVTIDGTTWMAENLNYADERTTVALQLRNACYGNIEENCTKGGRFYSWTAAMNLTTAYESALATSENMDGTGICPTGWHVPDTTEWQNLRKSVSSDAQSLMAVGAWSYYSSITPTNSSGFTAVPAGEDQSDEGGFETTFCTATQYNASRYYVFIMSYSSKNLSRDYTGKGYYCSLRCVKNSGTVVPTSSSSVVASSSSAESPAPSSAVVPTSSETVVPTSSEVVEESSSSAVIPSSAAVVETSSSEVIASSSDVVETSSSEEEE